tara:strand:- start:19 stop:234 length:216 start_codon:yes stop_codon:yes gene_type:complete
MKNNFFLKKSFFIKNLIAFANIKGNEKKIRLKDKSMIVMLPLKKLTVSNTNIDSIPKKNKHKNNQNQLIII